MTDDSNARYRSSDPFVRAPDPDQHGSDPLAELARLIGQSDQLSGREHHPAPREPQYYDDPPPPPQHDRPAYDSRYDDPPPQHDRPAYDSRYDDAYPPDPAQHSAPAPDWHSPAAAPFDPFAPASSRAPDLPDEPPQRTSHPEFSFPPLHAEHPQHSHSSSSFDPPPFGGPSRQEPTGMPSPPPLDEYYDDAPQGGRRKGLLTVAAVFVLAVVGTAGAFGYRTWFGGPSVKAAPTVIRASAEPAKVAPPAPAVDPNANKISYDRFGDRGQNEKVVLREEKPVDIKDATRAGMMTSAAPFAPAPSQPSAAAVPPNGANPPSVLTEPKRVRTVPIRPDTPDASTARSPMAAPANPPAAAPARQTAVASVAPSNAPLDLANPSSPPPQARAAAPRPAPPAAVRPAPAPPSANAPLSLAPETGSSPAVAARPAPTRVAAAPAGNGSYLVQVSSQRSEADAQAAFRSVKSKYSSLLGDRQPVIRRAELAGKGTYYRAMVGPFTTRDQAIQLCSSLKAAGGDCVVQAN